MNFSRFSFIYLVVSVMIIGLTLSVALVLDGKVARQCKSLSENETRPEHVPCFLPAAKDSRSWASVLEHSDMSTQKIQRKRIDLTCQSI